MHYSIISVNFCRLFTAAANSGHSADFHAFFCVVHPAWWGVCNSAHGLWSNLFADVKIKKDAFCIKCVFLYKSYFVSRNKLEGEREGGAI